MKTLRLLRVFAFASLLLTTAAGYAQYSADFQTNIISGVASNWAGDYVVGTNTIADVLLVQSSGVLSNGTGYLGYAVGASNNSAFVTDTGSVWSNRLGLVVGYSGAGNRLVISNGGCVFNSFGQKDGPVLGYLGYSSSSSNNTVLVSGAGSVWKNNSVLNVGYSGAGNSLVISNAGLVVDGNGYVGNATNSTGNSVLVTDAGSIWSNSTSVYVGYSGSGNSVVITNGGQLIGGYGYIGEHFNSSNNSVLVTGVASVWSNRVDLYVGDFGSSNALVISGGGRVSDVNGYVGYSSSTNNAVLVTGTGSIWSNQGGLSFEFSRNNSLVVSNGGQVINLGGAFFLRDTIVVTGTDTVWNSGNLSFAGGGSLVISNGGRVVNGDAYAGTGSGNSNFTARVADNAVWQNGALFVGNQGLDNSVTVAGGTVSATNLVIGLDSTTCDNRVQLDDGSLFVTNATGDAVLEVRYGKLILNGGTLRADKLVMTNDCGVFLRNSGTLIVGSLLLDPNLSAAGDGIPNGWKQQYGFDPFDSTVAGADPDGDGMSNLQEYLAGTDPLDNTSTLRITRIAREGDDIRVTWTMGSSRSNALQVTAGAVGGGFTNSFTDLFIVTNAVGSTTNYLDVGGATNGPSRFYRLRVVPAWAGVHYVNVNGATPVPPYTNWTTAATVIQDAVDVAAAGELILVNDGTYQTGGRPLNGYTLSNRVAVTVPITVQSVHGPAVTTIRGHAGIGSNAVRCVNLATNATLVGFTLTGGATHGTVDYEQFGGGISCSDGAVVSNCTITGNSASFSGGGGYFGTYNNCTFSGNSAEEGGGVASATLNNCTISGNSATWGGGAMYGTLNNCTISGNSASGTSLGQTVGEGGGAYQCALTNCLLSNNSTAVDGGGASWGTLVNCVVVGNAALQGGGTAGADLVNCTVVGNSVSFSGQYFPFGGGAFYGTAVNSILINNTAEYGAQNYYGTTFSNCCTVPDPGSGNNITNDPSFVNPGGGNYRLQSNSPCINSGNNGSVATTTDLDGNPRIAGGTVDIGAYEFQTPSSVISYAWLQQYGLPSDGTADYADSDGDGMNNWQEWMSGTDPTNSASAFRILSVVPTNSDLLISWTAGGGLTNVVQAAGDLTGTYSNISPDILLPGSGDATTNYLDAGAATNAPGKFYRVRLLP